METPVHKTRPARPPMASQDGRSNAGSGSSPRHAPTSATVATRTAAPPIHQTSLSPEAPPTYTAAATSEPATSTTTEAPTRDAPEDRLLARSIQRHRTTRSERDEAPGDSGSPGEPSHKSFTLPELPDHHQPRDFVVTAGHSL